MFSTAIVNDDNSSGSEASVTLGSGIAAAVAGTGALGSLLYCYYRKGNTNSNIVQNNFHLSDKKNISRGYSSSCCFDIEYYNPILNMPRVLESAYELGGVKGMDAIIETGADNVKYSQFKYDQKTLGFESAVVKAIERYETQSYNKYLGDNIKELGQSASYIPSVAYVLKEVIAPQFEGIILHNSKTRLIQFTIIVWKLLS